MRRWDCSRMHRYLSYICAIALAGLSACHSADDSAQSASASLKPVTVQQTFEQLRSWHAAGAYSAMRPHLAPVERDGTIDLLVAVDELLAANHAALAAVQHACPDLDVSRYDLSAIEDNLDLFSRNVDLVRVDQDGDEATVLAQVSGRLPLERMTFRREAGEWVYVPGPVNVQLLDLIHHMKRALDQVAVVASANSQLTPSQVENEYKLRVMPKVARLGQLAEQSRTPASSRL